jgi:hypothetical protein
MNRMHALCDRVLRTDNAPRVRDGYVSEGTPGHGRALPTPAEGSICRTNALADDRACAPLPPQNFHGKEGVDGSSPSEGSAKPPQNGLFFLGMTCRIASVRWVWSPLWSLQVENSVLEGASPCFERATSSTGIAGPVRVTGHRPLAD